jgi:hypothetical protein
MSRARSSRGVSISTRPDGVKSECNREASGEIEAGSLCRKSLDFDAWVGSFCCAGQRITVVILG